MSWDLEDLYGQSSQNDDEHCYECGNNEASVFSSNGDRWCIPCYQKVKAKREAQSEPK
jgi:hypothetical protein